MKNNLNPVVIYENADTQKELIVKDNRGKAGVYRWINKENGNSYGRKLRKSLKKICRVLQF